MFVVRPIARDDLPAVLALSERTGTGLTTLPASRERLAERIEASIASFERRAPRADECYVFVLEDAGPGASTGRVVGISAIEAAVGLDEPWYNFRVGTLVHASRALDVYTAVPTLFLANDHTGHTELCTLFVDQAFRQGHNGPLIAKSRLLFIAEFADRFGDKVIAELRGPLDADGRSPFWEGLGRHFFAMEYSTADYLTGHRAEGVHRRADAQAPGLREPAAARCARGDRRGARRHGAGATHARAGRLPLRRLRRHLRRRARPSRPSATTSTRCGARACCRSRSRSTTRCPTTRSAASAGWSPTGASTALPRDPRDRAAAHRPFPAASLRGGRARRRAKATACARCRSRRTTASAGRADGHRRPVRRIAGPDAQLLGDVARQPRVRAPRRPRVEPARGRAAGPGQDARGRRARPCAGGAAAARAAAPADAARAGLRRQRRRRDRAGRARRARAAVRVLVGLRDVVGERRDRERVGRHGGRPRALHAGEPRVAAAPLDRGADDDGGAARDLRRRAPLRRARSAAGRRRSPATRARRTTRASRVRASAMPASSCTCTAAAPTTPTPPRRGAIRRGRRARRPRRSRGAMAWTPARVVHARQHPAAIDAGVFHNDVIAVGQGRTLLVHESAWVDTPARSTRCAERIGPRFAPTWSRADELAGRRRGRDLPVQQPAARARRRRARCSSRRPRCASTRARPRRARSLDRARRAARRGARLRPAPEHAQRRRPGVPAPARAADAGRARRDPPARVPRRRRSPTRSRRGSDATTATASCPPTSPIPRCSTSRAARSTSSRACSRCRRSTRSSATDAA